MYRVRFIQDSEDFRPVYWPIKYPYWCTGYDNKGGAIMVAYVDDEKHLKSMWPKAKKINLGKKTDSFIFTELFTKPEWFQEPTENKEATQ
jgi:hypothetical protein